ncbi:kinase domain-containing protein [Hypoxylon argillaceum]|nr:kinase domain-containing protein [Hypoxylon argillaceum]
MSCISTSCAPSMSVAQGFRSAEPEKGSNAPTGHNTVQRAASHIQSRENTGQDDNIEDGVSSSSNLSDRHVDDNRVDDNYRIPPKSPVIRTLSPSPQQICATSNTKEKSFQKVFAILITIEKVDSITEFLHEGVHDGDLPLMRLHRDGREGVFDFGRRSKEGKASHPLKCFESFPLMNFENFDQYQWAMLAPIFRHTCQESAKCYEFHDKIILPFIEEEGVSEGGFGRVSRVKIHPTSNNQFAVKRLKSHDKQVFRAEFDMLSKFSKNTHPHLISLLAAYTHQKSFPFLFPWAEADLAIFWRKIKPKPRIEETMLWVARQCARIADSLSKIHEYNSFCGDGAAHTTQGFTRQRGGIKLYGRHGDIRPANILWFSNLEDANNGGTLKLTDFGLAEFHTMDSRSNRPRRQIGTSDVYRPPEYDMPDGKISRSYDIWTIGCLYLEFIAWLLGGWDLVRSFNIKRTPLEATWCLGRCDYTFFELEGKREMPRVKRAVTEFIRIDLHGLQACTQYLHEFIDLIEEELLLVEIGKTNSKRRIECGPLCSRLNKMYEQCAKDQEYAMRLTPWMENL